MENFIKEINGETVYLTRGNCLNCHFKAFSDPIPGHVSKCIEVAGSECLKFPSCNWKLKNETKNV